MIEGMKFSNQIVPSEIDTKYKDCNFTHTNCIEVAGKKQGVRIFPDDDTPRTFIDCNMTNCEPPPNSTVIHCNTVIIERMVVVSSDTIVIDGETIVFNEYADRNHARYINGAYKYQPVPIDTPREAK